MNYAYDLGAPRSSRTLNRHSVRVDAAYYHQHLVEEWRQKQNNPNSEKLNIFGPV